MQEEPPPATLTSLDDNAIVLILSVAGPRDASSALSTCRALADLASSVWHSLVTRSAPLLARTTPSEWGLPDGDYRAMLFVVERFVLPWTSTYFVLLSDHPWCRLFKFQHALKEEGGQRGLQGVGLTCRFPRPTRDGCACRGLRGA